MSYHKDRYQGVGAIAAAAHAPRSAPAPTITRFAKNVAMITPPPPTRSAATIISPGVQVVRVAPTPPSILKVVPTFPSNVTAREARLFTPAAVNPQRFTNELQFYGAGSGGGFGTSVTPATPSVATGGNTLRSSGGQPQVGSGIGQPPPKPPPPPIPTETDVTNVMRENVRIINVRVPAPVVQIGTQPPPPTPTQQYGAPSVDPAITYVSPVSTPATSSSSNLPWLLIGGGVLAYLLLKD